MAFAEVPVYRLHDPFRVPDEGLGAVRLQIADRVPAVVAKVVEDEIEPVCEQRPERIVRVGGESVGVAQNELQPLRIPVPPENDGSTVVHRDLDRRTRLGRLPATPAAVDFRDTVHSTGANVISGNSADAMDITWLNTGTPRTPSRIRPRSAYTP